MTTYTALFLIFCIEYVYHEHVHLYTFDLFAEKVWLDRNEYWST